MTRRKIMLLFPPEWVPTAPYLALPSLTAVLREAGHHDLADRVDTPQRLADGSCELLASLLAEPNAGVLRMLSALEQIFPGVRSRIERGETISVPLKASDTSPCAMPRRSSPIKDSWRRTSGSVP